jgi:hypothetical protein
MADALAVLARLDEIEQAALAATPGPWESDGDDPEAYSEGDVSVWSKHVDDPCPEPEHGGILFNVGPPITQVGVACNREREDGRFIAGSRGWVPALCSAVRALEERVKELEEKHAQATQCFGALETWLGHGRILAAWFRNLPTKEELAIAKVSLLEAYPHGIPLGAVPSGTQDQEPAP